MVKPDAEAIIRIIADNNGITVAETKGLIVKRVREGLASPDPNIRLFWSLIPKKSHEATAEEAVFHLALIILRTHGIC